MFIDIPQCNFQTDKRLRKKLLYFKNKFNVSSKWNFFANMQSPLTLFLAQHVNSKCYTFIYHLIAKLARQKRGKNDKILIIISISWIIMWILWVFFIVIKTQKRFSTIQFQSISHKFIYPGGYWLWHSFIN